MALAPCGWLWAGLVLVLGKAKHGKLPSACARALVTQLALLLFSLLCPSRPQSSPLLPRVGTQLDPAPYPKWDKIQFAYSADRF